MKAIGSNLQDYTIAGLVLTYVCSKARLELSKTERFGDIVDRARIQRANNLDLVDRFTYNNDWDAHSKFAQQRA
jgi:hypothetical protein